MNLGFRSKYGNKRYVVDGINFASTKEARRYQELKFAQLAGEISGLNTQVRYELQPTFLRDGKVEPLTRHSEKPAIVREQIKKLMGGGACLELFARKEVLGWDSWGDEI